MKIIDENSLESEGVVVEETDEQIRKWVEIRRKKHHWGWRVENLIDIKVFDVVLWAKLLLKIANKTIRQLISKDEWKIDLLGKVFEG